MKKMISFFMVAVLMLQLVPSVVSAAANDVYYDQDFEEITALSDSIAKLSDTSPGMALSVVNAKDMGISENNNNVLKLDLAAGTKTDTRVLEFGLQSGNTQISIDKRLQFQMDFYKTDHMANVSFFKVYDDNGKGKPNGLVQLIRDSDPVYAGRFKDGTGTLIYGSDSGATNDAKGIIPVGTWYRLTINWTPSSTSPDNTLEEVTLTRLSDSAKVFTVNNVAVSNSAYPMAYISKLQMGITMYNNNPAQQIYFDNIKISELEAVEEFKLVSPSNGEVKNSVNNLTLEFNHDVDETTLDEISFTSTNFADPIVESAVINGSDNKKVDVTLKYPLISNGNYTVYTGGVKNDGGSECTTVSSDFKVGKVAPADAIINEDFSSLSNVTSDAANGIISNVCENGDWLAKIAVTNETKNKDGLIINMVVPVSSQLELDENGVIFETDYYPSGAGFNEGIFTLKINGQNWREISNGLVFVQQNSGKVPTFKTFDGSQMTELLVGTAGHVYNIKYHLSKSEGKVLGKAYIYDYNTGLLTASDPITLSKPINSINEIGFMQKSWGAGETKYGHLFVYPATGTQYVSSEIAGEVLENYHNLSFDIKFNSVLNINTINNIKVMSGSLEIPSVKTLIADSKTVRVDVTGSLPELSTIYVVCDDVENTYYQPVVNSTFSFQTASAHKVTGWVPSDASITPNTSFDATVNFRNNVAENKYATILIAVYEKSGNVYEMKNVSASIGATVIPGESGIPVSVNVPADIDASKAVVKVIILDNMESMTPICDNFNFPE